MSHKRWLWFFMLPVVMPPPAWAIPSPDIVINIFASAGQVLGLLSVTFGGIAVSWGRGKKRSEQSGSPWPLRISLACLALTGISFALYYAYTLDLRNKRLNANLVRSSTEEGKKVGDTSLATLSLSGQLRHPRGIATGELSRWMADGVALNLIDVREPEETEAGMITGAAHRRYPDLLVNRQGLTVDGHMTVLICFSGNRSSELTERFTAEGIACHFMIGGYEKWLAEGRSVGDGGASPKELRKLPYFKGNDVLLETQEVEKLVARKKALFVDVRYPGDFASGHLPGAVNVPLRKMTSEAMGVALKALPKGRSVIAPCYDRRSSFYALILGLRLTRLGYDFRGRYTVPHEFTLLSGERTYVGAWRERQEASTFLGTIGKPIQWILYRVQNRTGNFLFAILFTVGALRILLLPFSVKMEIDRIREQRRAPQIAKLKEKLKREPRRLARAVAGISREDGITPVFNMVGSIVQMVLMLALFSVVGAAAEKFGGDLLWMKPVSSPDPYRVMPLIVSAVIFIHLYLSAQNHSKKKMTLYAFSTGIIYLITFNIAGALNIYLAMSAGLLMLQGAAVRGVFRWRDSAKRRKAARSPKGKGYRGIVPLRHLTESSGGGNKALKLAEMMAAGFPVPDGFVVASDLLARETFSKRELRKIDSAWKALGATTVAVRSSGLNEDGAEMSYAGVFESILSVTRENLLSALKEVGASLGSARAQSYSGQEELGGVVIQEMVDAEYAGVMFTEHPGTSGSLMIEVVEGLGESLVSGQATPEPYQFGRYTGLPMFDGEPPMDLAPLIALGRRVEERFKVPQDIEWAFAKGKFYLLQTRDITSDSRRGAGEKGVFERERFRLLELLGSRGKAETVLRQNELSEILPHPTRLSLSMMERIWEPGGTVDLACARLGIPYHVQENSEPFVMNVFGSLYVNCEEERKRAGKGPGAIATFRLSRAAEAIERSFREEFLPGYLGRMQMREALELGRLPLAELVKLFGRWERTFVTDVYVRAEVVNVAAEYYLQVAKTALAKRGQNPAEYLGNLPRTVVSSAMGLLPQIRTGKQELHDFLNLFGHRAPHDFELSMPRYRENLEEVMRMVSRATEECAADLRGEKPATGDRLLDITVERARRFQTLKEEAKHHSLRLFAQMRRLLVEMDRRLGFSGGIFKLDVSEVLRLADDSFVSKAFGLIETRGKEYAFEGGDAPPIEFTLEGLERFGLDLSLAVSGAAETELLRGLRISGSGEGVGRVRVLNSPDDLDLFESGEILVTRFTDPTWTPVFPLAAGVITEVGGWLSHAAILAREMNLVGVVGVKDATRLLSTGDFVRLHEDGTVEIDKSIRREEVRHLASRIVSTVWDGQMVEAKLVDVSRTGARMEVDPFMAGELKKIESGTIHLPGEEGEIAFTLIRVEAGTLGVCFETELAMETIDLLRQDRATLFEKQQSSREVQTQLLAVSTEIHTELELRSLVKKIMAATTQLLKVERSTLFMYDGRTRELWSLVAEGTGEKEIRFPSHMGIAGAVFTNGETINIPDAYADLRFNPEVDRKTNYRTRSILCMPIEKDGKRMGVMQVLNKLAGPFDAADETRLNGFSGQVSVALENARLFDEAMRIKAYSESIIESIGEGVLALDSRDRIVRCNGASMRILQTEPEEILGLYFGELFVDVEKKEETVAESMDRFRKAIESGVAERVIRAGGREARVNLRAIPLQDSSQDSVGSMLLFSEAGQA